MLREGILIRAIVCGLAALGLFVAPAFARPSAVSFSSSRSSSSSYSASRSYSSPSYSAPRPSVAPSSGYVFSRPSGGNNSYFSAPSRPAPAPVAAPVQASRVPRPAAVQLASRPSSTPTAVPVTAPRPKAVTLNPAPRPIQAAAPVAPRQYDYGHQINANRTYTTTVVHHVYVPTYGGYSIPTSSYLGPNPYYYGGTSYQPVYGADNSLMWLIGGGQRFNCINPQHRYVMQRCSEAGYRYSWWQWWFAW